MAKFYFSHFKDPIPALDHDVWIKQYRKAEKRLFMFDYDGTLTPIVSHPSEAIPTDHVLHTLKALSSDPKNDVWIISGRGQDFLTEVMKDVPDLGFSAEHGSFMKYPGSQEWENLAAKSDLGWQDDVEQIFSNFVGKTPGSWTERKQIALVWHYRNAEADLGPLRAVECYNIIEDTVSTKYDLEVMAGKMCVEVRPRTCCKGAVAKRLLRQHDNRNQNSPSFVVCVGDDRTDEDMFDALLLNCSKEHEIFTCIIGDDARETSAKWHCSTPDDLVNAVASLLES